MSSTGLGRRHWLTRGWLGTAALCGLLRPALAQEGTDALALGVVPNVSPRVLAAQYQPLREHLAGALRREVQLVTAPDFASFDQRCRDGQGMAARKGVALHDVAPGWGGF